MPALHIASDLELPLDAVTSTLVVFGGKGMGKTNFGSVEVEEFKAAGLRFAVLDPLGVWWGLRHSANGKRPGIEVLILGGIHGDIPIEPTAGEVVADLVADEEVDVIIDISRRPNGKLWSQGERIRFVTAYCTRLFERQGERRRALHQVIDEAGRFVPQNYPSGDKDVPLCLGAIEQLVEWGRNVGVGVTLITQRSARINKSVTELADCMVAFRTVGPRSIEAILDWFGEHIPKARWNELVEVLRQLDVGTALVVSPGWLKFEGVAHIRPRQTFDSSATPEPGQSAQQPTGKAAQPDLKQYQALMAATIEKAKADDPRELRRRIMELERQLSQHTPDVAQLIERQQRELAAAQQRMRELEETVREPVVTPEQLDGLRSVLAPAQAAIGSLERAAEAFTDAIDRLMRRVEAAAVKPAAQPVPRSDPVPREQRRPPPTTPAPRPQPSPPSEAGPISPSEQKILDVLATLEVLGLESPHRASVAALAGYSHTGGRFKNLIGSLRTAGFIAYPTAQTVQTTPAGAEIANPTMNIRSLGDLHAAWYEQVGPSHAKVLRALVEAGSGTPMTRDELGAATGYEPSGGRFKNILGALRTLQLIEYPTSSTVAASDLLFPPLPA